MGARPTKVLLIEEDRDMRYLMRSALEAVGHIVAEATRGEIGLELAKRFGPAVIVLDAVLPDMAGQVVLEELKREILTADAPVILLVAAGELRRTIGPPLVAARIEHPVIAEQLVSTVQRVMPHAT